MPDSEKQAVIQDLIKSSEKHYGDYVKGKIFEGMVEGKKRMGSLSRENSQLKEILRRMRWTMWRTYKKSCGKERRYKKWVVMN